jgi:hypothetical protein
MLLWCYGVVMLCCYGVVVLWCCGVVLLWCCGVMVLCCFGVVVLCIMVLWVRVTIYENILFLLLVSMRYGGTFHSSRDKRGR